MSDPREVELAKVAELFGVPVEYLRQLPRHDPDCLIGKPHLTCTCGVYARARRS